MSSAETGCKVCFLTYDKYGNDGCIIKYLFIFKQKLHLEINVSAVRKFVENYTFNSRVTKHQKSNCINHRLKENAFYLIGRFEFEQCRLVLLPYCTPMHD